VVVVRVVLHHHHQCQHHHHQCKWKRITTQTVIILYISHHDHKRKDNDTPNNTLYLHFVQRIAVSLSFSLSLYLLSFFTIGFYQYCQCDFARSTIRTKLTGVPHNNTQIIHLFLFTPYQGTYRREERSSRIIIWSSINSSIFLSLLAIYNHSPIVVILSFSHFVSCC